ncbi:UNVERIFIED_CONTAM: Peptide-N4-(N-acetyl-beta-glucosaminyl)asparagine amidase A [Sesamum radiatum]|uniref:Peptide-N4-(N-acetyl-beta-glucosaminyl)asparagine amidase A n=1 Tax=Sesamum radiatum TaxID=300843 RepID=A0AAW2KDL8_SESRA
MHPSLLLLLLLTLIPPLSASSPPPHHSHLTKHRRKSTTPPQEYIEVRRPLPSDSLGLTRHARSLSSPTASATPSTFPPPTPPIPLPVTARGPALSSNSPPPPMDPSTTESPPSGSPVLSSFARALPSPPLMGYSGMVNLTFLYYDVAGNGTTNKTSNLALSLFSSNRKSNIRKLKDSPVPPTLKSSLDLDEKPADLIIPISAIGDEGFWFRIESESDAVYQGIQIPLNTYRAVIEVYVSFHGNDEFWYSNPPDSYIELNGLSTKRGHGAYREVLVKLDDNVVGSVVPFPVIFTGGINPLFWEPVVAIGAFDLPSYEIELTPFLGMLLDGKVHYFGLGVADAISFWLVDANLHLWLDDKVDKVQAGPIKYDYPSRCVERESEFQQLDGEFEIEGKRETEFSGWVNSTAGNFTTYLWSKLKFENTIKFKNNGTEKEVKQKVKVTNEVKVESASGASVSSITVKRKYPLKITTSTLAGSGKDMYLMITKLEHSLEEEKQDGNLESTFDNSQKSSGWMVVQDHDVLSGAATTYQSYVVEDSFGCFNRQVLAENGSIKNDTRSFLCARATS